MDDKDYKIISMLMKNARIPKTSIAKAIGISETAVRKRILNLEKRGIILGYKVSIDYKKANIFASLTGVDVKPENIWKVINVLKSMSEVSSVMLTSGDHTIMIEVVTKSLDELQNLHEKIATINGVERVCPSVILEIIK